MKSILFVVYASLLIASTISASIKGGSCPKPTAPTGASDWDFSYFTDIKGWYQIGYTQATRPRTVYNTIEINHLYPGKVSVTFTGDTRESGAQFLWDKKIDTIVGDFGGKSYYDVVEIAEPVSFNYTTEDNQKATFWMPYYSDDDRSAVLATCVENGDGTIDANAWFVAKTKSASIPDEVQQLIHSLMGKSFSKTCQGDFC